eukprot:6368418-Karenia_brevis.AAC.1
MLPHVTPAASPHPPDFEYEVDPFVAAPLPSEEDLEEVPQTLQNLKRELEVNKVLEQKRKGEQRKAARAEVLSQAARTISGNLVVNPEAM